jgi:hypothetical protein
MSPAADRPDLEPLESEVERARRALAAADPRQVAERAGCEPSDDGAGVSVPLLGRAYRVSLPQVRAFDPEGKPAPGFVEDLLVLHLAQADGTALAGEWQAFRELPEGIFYHQAFASYSGQALVRAFGNDVEGFATAAAGAGGEPEPLGDCGFRFRVLPRVMVAMAYWRGDDEFPPNAEVLFDGAAHHYLPPYVLAVVGGWLTGQVIKRRA